MGHEIGIENMKRLFPDLLPEEQQQADEILRRYFAFVIHFYNRLNATSEEHPDSLTDEFSDNKNDSGRTFTNKYDTSV